MRNFQRKDLEFSLCGLNCQLCTMKLDQYCPGCGGGDGNQGCSIARCSLQSESIEYCYQCKEYPCEKYEGIEAYDSFIIHRNQRKDMKKAEKIGMAKYHIELKKKADFLKYLLTNYNDGRRKSFFSMAVNLLDLHDLENIIEEIKLQTKSMNFTSKENANIAVSVFQTVAEKRNVILKLNKKSKKKPIKE